MGLNRTTFGRHTSMQKSKYNAKCNDLNGEINKLFDALTDSLDKKSVSVREMNQAQLSNLIIPLRVFREQKVLSKLDLEATLIKFYNDVIELMQPIQPQSERTPRQQQQQHQSESVQSSINLFIANNNAHLPPFLSNNSTMNQMNNLPFNLLITFCLIFGYNLANDNSESSCSSHAAISSGSSSAASSSSRFNNSLNRTNFNLNTNGTHSQLKHILKQVQEIEKENFARRIKIIYFLLIMYTSFGTISPSIDSFWSIDNGEGNYYGQASYLNQQQQQSNNNDDLLLFVINDETNEIQRTFLDLLNSQIDMEKNTAASMRVSLLLKLEQFI
jgi:hypothetical protein